MIREKYKIDDIQKIIYTILTKLTTTTSPFTRWAVIYGFPESEVFEEFTSPFIYVEAPVLVDKWGHQGGKRNFVWEQIIGAWDDRKTGGDEEINIMCSQLVAFFEDTKLCHSTTTFNVTLGTTTYTGTNLITLGVRIEDTAGPRELVDNTDLKEFRRELTLTIST